MDVNKTPTGEELPDDDVTNQSDDPSEEGHLIEEHLEEDPFNKRRRKKRIKVRKRVRIKRKSSPQKKAKKILEKVAWVLIIAAFIITLLVLVLQLDFSSKHRKKSVSDVYKPTSRVYFNDYRHA